MIPLKNINYRGGIIRFSIPANWLEEYKASGGGTFCENTPDSGTLRLNVLTFGFQRGNLPPDAPFNALTKPDGSRVVERLPNDTAMARYVVTKPENDEKLHIQYWEVAFPLKPSQLCIAVFSYTLLAAQASQTRFVEEIQLLDASIRKAECAQSAGIVGDYFQEIGETPNG